MKCCKQRKAMSEEEWGKGGMGKVEDMVTRYAN